MCDDISMLYVPVGSNCKAARFLITRGLRRHAFPFDWTACTLDAVSDLIENGFSTWMGDLVFGEIKPRLYSDGKVKKPMTDVWCRSSRVLFLHDFDDSQDCVRHVRSKYKRRINRFRKIMQSDTKIGFVCDLECTDNSSLQNTLDFIAPGNDIMPSRQTVAAQIARFIRTIREAYPGLCFKMLSVQNDRLVELSIDEYSDITILRYKKP